MNKKEGHELKSETELLNVLQLICRRMFETRPKTEIKLMPYTHPDFAKRNLRQDINIDLSALFPHAQNGDFSYICTALKSSDDTELSLLTNGAEEICLNGENIPIVGETYEQNNKTFTIVHINVNKGYNELIFKCTKSDADFGLDYQVSHISYPFLWVCDYLLWERDTVPLPGFEDEQGFAVTELLKSGENKAYASCNIVFPKPTAPDTCIDFNALYTSGTYAYALSYAKADGELRLQSTCPLKVYVNGKESTTVRQGDMVIVECEKKAGTWGFESLSNTILHLPMLSGNRNLHWLLLGGFSAPALPQVQFVKPYEGADGAPTFWRFADKNTYLRPYLDSCFYGQWFYGLMVGQYGLLRASKYLPECYAYFKESMRILALYYPYMQYDAKTFGDATFIKRSVKTDDLDSIGTIGMNLYELYIRETDENVKKDILFVLNRLAESIYKNIPRMEDKTFYRIHTMWADDTFMSCPFLVRMGNLTGNTKYYDEVILQLKNYKKKLFIEEENIFSHIYFPEDQQANKIPWGRGNGWVYLALTEVIEHLPDGYPGKEDVIDIFKTAVRGLLPLQDENGMWHQVLNRPDSYAETSCTAIFTIALAKGVRMGILEKDLCLPKMQKAVDALLKYSVNENGDILGVCRGSSCSYDVSYYLNLKTICGDDHGTGVVLAAICEVLEGEL